MCIMITRGGDRVEEAGGYGWRGGVSEMRRGEGRGVRHEDMYPSIRHKSASVTIIEFLPAYS